MWKCKCRLKVYRLCKKSNDKQYTYIVKWLKYFEDFVYRNKRLCIYINNESYLFS